MSAAVARLAADLQIGESAQLEFEAQQRAARVQQGQAPEDKSAPGFQTNLAGRLVGGIEEKPPRRRRALRGGRQARKPYI